MTDMMVDLETTGTSSPDRNGIIQLSAIKFNFGTEKIGPSFDRCPSLLATRHWDEDTRQFWQGKNRNVFMSIVAREEPAIAVYGDFIRFCHEGAPEGGYRFWAKPTHFDWPLLSSHIHQMGAVMPMHYRLARDLNTFCAAMKGQDMAHANMEGVVHFEGDQHNALHDCAYQIDCLFAAKHGNFSEVLS